MQNQDNFDQLYQQTFGGNNSAAQANRPLSAPQPAPAVNSGYESYPQPNVQNPVQPVQNYQNIPPAPNQPNQDTVRPPKKKSRGIFCSCFMIFFVLAILGIIAFVAILISQGSLQLPSLSFLNQNNSSSTGSTSSTASNTGPIAFNLTPSQQKQLGCIPLDPAWEKTDNIGAITIFKTPQIEYSNVMKEELTFYINVLPDNLFSQSPVGIIVSNIQDLSAVPSIDPHVSIVSSCGYIFVTENFFVSSGNSDSSLTAIKTLTFHLAQASFFSSLPDDVMQNLLTTGSAKYDINNLSPVLKQYEDAVGWEYTNSQWILKDSEDAASIIKYGPSNDYATSLVTYLFTSGASISQSRLDYFNTFFEVENRVEVQQKLLIIPVGFSSIAPDGLVSTGVVEDFRKTFDIVSISAYQNPVAKTYSATAKDYKEIFTNLGWETLSWTEETESTGAIHTHGELTNGNETIDIEIITFEGAKNVKVKPEGTVIVIIEGVRLSEE